MDMSLAGAAVEGPRERVAEAAQRPLRQPRGASRLAQQSFGSPASAGTLQPPHLLLILCHCDKQTGCLFADNLEETKP